MQKSDFGELHNLIEEGQITSESDFGEICNLIEEGQEMAYIADGKSIEEAADSIE